MTMQENIQKIISSASMTFLEREQIIFRGLVRYVTGCLGEFLTASQVEDLAVTLRTLRSRQADVAFDESLCRCITEEREVRHRYIPRKALKRDEAALLLYNIAPYALLTRRETAQLAKCLFPNFFGSVPTIYTLFTRMYNADGSVSEAPRSLAIEVMPDHSTGTVERVFYELGLVDNETLCHEEV
jgi:hypothetical protein